MYICDIPPGGLKLFGIFNGNSTAIQELYRKAACIGTRVKEWMKWNSQKSKAYEQFAYQQYWKTVTRRKRETSSEAVQSNLFITKRPINSLNKFNRWRHLWHNSIIIIQYNKIKNKSSGIIISPLKTLLWFWNNLYTRFVQFSFLQ